MSYICQDYRDFIAPDCDRVNFIVQWLEDRGVKAVVMPIEGRNHIYVIFSQGSYDGTFRIKTVIAHYDRFEGSPGANDNSSSVWALMNWAVKLNQSGIRHNIRLIFTDGEELGSGGNGTGASSQGAFGLAGVFKRLGITEDQVYVFDCMGRGTVPVLQRTLLPAKTPDRMKKRFQQLFARTQNLLQTAGKGTWVTLPVSYSDNAGFLVHGIAAVAITMLPQNETSKYMFDLMNVPALEKFVTNHQVPEGSSLQEMENLLPETWRLLHTEGDNLESLTEESFLVMEGLLELLEKSNTIIE